MNLSHLLSTTLVQDGIETTDDLDADIREELEFHLAMLIEDNLRAGMPPVEARREAERRFGNVDACRRACRRIALGPKLLLQRLQMGVVIVLIAIVIGQTALFLRLQSSRQQEIEMLRRAVQSLQRAAYSGNNRTATPVAKIPYVQWPQQSLSSARTVETTSAVMLSAWGSKRDPLAHAWTDWQTLGIPDAR